MWREGLLLEKGFHLFIAFQLTFCFSTLRSKPSKIAKEHSWIFLFWRRCSSKFFWSFWVVSHPLYTWAPLVSKLFFSLSESKNAQRCVKTLKQIKVYQTMLILFARVFTSWNEQASEQWDQVLYSYWLNDHIFILCREATWSLVVRKVPDQKCWAQCIAFLTSYRESLDQRISPSSAF